MFNNADENDCVQEKCVILYKCDAIQYVFQTGNGFCLLVKTHSPSLHSLFGC